MLYFETPHRKPLMLFARLTVSMAAGLIAGSPLAFAAPPSQPRDHAKVLPITKPAPRGDEIATGITSLGPLRRAASPLRIRSYDVSRRIDVNRINMWASNYGTFAWDIVTGSPGLVFPKGSGKRVVFVSGLWLGAEVGSETRVTVAEYSSEYGPGAMMNGSHDDPNRPEYQVYKVTRWTGNPDDSSHVDRTPAELAADPDLDPLAHHSWSEYMAGAAPHGAPTRVYRLPLTSTPIPFDSIDVVGPDVRGDQMLWAVYNDANPANHYGFGGATLPLGVEVQQTTWGFDRPGPLGNTVFLRFQIINKGFGRLENMYASAWSDPDVGDFTDDLAGCDTTSSLGFAYNATSNDAVYGTAVPAVGYDVLAGPALSSGGNQPMISFSRYTNGTDPSSFMESYNYMRGLDPTGAPFVNPVDFQETAYMVSGDPLLGSGWLDSNPADRRMLLASGPFTMAPGDTTELVVAIVIGDGASTLESIARLYCYDDHVQTFYKKQGIEPPDPAPCEAFAANCPRVAEYWGAECGPGEADLADAQLDDVASRVNQQSTFFGWTPGGERDAFCAALNDHTDIRAEAKRQFAALLGNVEAGQLGIVPASGQPIRLNLLTSISCPGVTSQSIAELVHPAGTVPELYLAEYADLNPTHRRPIDGVNGGGTAFNGGAGVARDFLGSSLDPGASPDSFATVEIRFDQTATKKAYRYLRLERQSTGGAPPQGRAYYYAGFHTVNFTCWDIRTNQQLDCAFSERTLTDDSGTILDPGAQPATFDSTWAPDASDLGGREYLFVIRRPYSPTPKPELAVDGAPKDGLWPALYMLWSRLRDPGDVFDDGDRFRFVWGIKPTPGVDARLIALDGQSLSDPAVSQEYSDIVSCLSDINRGIGIGLTCDVATSSLVSLIQAEAVAGRVRLAWHVANPPGRVIVERRPQDEEWQAVAAVLPDGAGRVEYEDSSVHPGERYGYRLMLDGEAAGEAWVEVPVQARLSLEGLRPNPASRQISVAFVLRVRGSARLELMDVAGRRVLARGFEGLEPGSHVIALPEAARLPAGLYVVRLVQNHQAVTRKAAIVW